MPGVDSASKKEYQDISGGKGGRYVGVTTLPPSCADCLAIWSLNLLNLSRPRRPVMGVLYFTLLAIFLTKNVSTTHDNIKGFFKQWNGEVRTEYIWLRRGQAFVNAITNLRVPKIEWNFWTG